ncbi:DUF2938 domain-containing protein [Marinovum sp.]|uniref:DUF2938 domain-containing protein n=1 Tax=Marinovum sp. TaxID=2024839 RepID=UPI002B275E18|nr:DUF2938 domain-containing protein [Marinovum sp.]
MGELILAGLFMGLGGTLAMDIWSEVLARGFGQPRPAWARIGRWAAHLPGGRVFHPDINAVAPVSGELALGWGVHYFVGLSYGVLFALLAGHDWLDAPSFLPLWAYALVTVGAGWFLLQPGMGLGWAAARTPNPWKVRGMGLVAHTVFGLGMYAVAVLAAP